MTNMIGHPSASPERQIQESKYNAARLNLLLVVAFTAINIILFVANGNYYLLFSAFLPYVLPSIGMELCGMLPPEYYDEYYEGGYAAQEFFSPSVFYVLLGISVAILALYVVAWLFSKNQKGGWLIFALVLFGLDTVFMLIGGISVDMLLDYVFHAWVIYELVVGVVAWRKLKMMPIEDPVPVSETETPPTDDFGMPQ